MPIGILFWVLMVIWFFLVGYHYYNAGIIPLGSNLLLFIIICLIGWRLFGPILQ